MPSSAGEEETPKRIKTRSREKEEVRKIEKWRIKEGLQYPFNVKNLDDLIHIAWNYEGDAFDWFMLWRLIPHLTELQRLVGMDKLKEEIVNFIMYHIQGLNNNKDGEGEMFHTVLAGPPGVGKTTVAQILAKIYCGMGFLSTDNVTTAKRSDFIGKWIGHSESQTMEILKKAKGGVLFIDEAYSMGHKDKTDSFAKASVDLINQYLSENKKDFICIIAGYEKELEESFFSINPGLRRRFPWKFKIEGYSSQELHEMFKRKVAKEGWILNEGAITDSVFENNKNLFTFFGGDIETFFSICKVSHTRRIFGSTTGLRNINKQDVDNAIISFKEHRKIDEDDETPSHPSMYL